MPTKPKIYTAGAISSISDRNAGWRSKLDSEMSDVIFLHPTETHNEYENHQRAGCVTEDINMIEKSEGIIALITRPEQVGTVTEVVHGITSLTPVLLLINPSQWDFRKDHKLPYQINTPIQYHTSEYWFLVNYILGDEEVELPDGSTIPGWKGFPESIAWVTTIDSLLPISKNWIQEVIV